ncbi:isoeugenol synthase 1-like [Amborella trichopoda]|uniref:isoeugenol synthase 1-like n=1 Tax=Amborella trichopoda TaxID=13333 RepID=UPI0005D3381D|nr:isoeugenol synthase 1-like [Amborella trichopoda]|eukprot:XP_011628888.1 isoeugenol synthase 1-like [Amborella trichopoda]
MTFEEDIAAFTIRAVDDIRTLNRVVICKPPKNVISQLDLISLWEKRCGKSLTRNFLSEDQIIKLTESQSNLELEEDDLELSHLYPDYNYTPIADLIDVFAVKPLQIKRSALG